MLVSSYSIDGGGGLQSFLTRGKSDIPCLASSQAAALCKWSRIPAFPGPRCPCPSWRKTHVRAPKPFPAFLKRPRGSQLPTASHLRCADAFKPKRLLISSVTTGGGTVSIAGAAARHVSGPSHSPGEPFWAATPCSQYCPRRQHTANVTKRPLTVVLHEAVESPFPRQMNVLTPAMTKTSAAIIRGERHK